MYDNLLFIVLMITNLKIYAQSHTITGLFNDDI